MIKLIISLFLGVVCLGCAKTQYSLVEKYMLENYLIAKLDGKDIYIDRESLHVKGNYALLKSPPKLQDGSDSYEYFLDTGYSICLEKVDGEWQVVYDLSRGDVPDELQWKGIIQEFPKKFPKELLSKFWQEGLK